MDESKSGCNATVVFSLVPTNPPPIITLSQLTTLQDTVETMDAAESELSSERSIVAASPRLDTQHGSSLTNVQESLATSTESLVAPLALSRPPPPSKLTSVSSFYFSLNSISTGANNNKTFGSSSMTGTSGDVPSKIHRKPTYQQKQQSIIKKRSSRDRIIKVSMAIPSTETSVAKKAKSTITSTTTTSDVFQSIGECFKIRSKKATRAGERKQEFKPTNRSLKVFSGHPVHFINHYDPPDAASFYGAGHELWCQGLMQQQSSLRVFRPVLPYQQPDESILLRPRKQANQQDFYAKPERRFFISFSNDFNSLPPPLL